MHQTSSGRRVLYLAHESAPKDFTGVDVTDLANPKVVVQTDLDHSHLRSNSLSILGDTMLVAYQSQQHGQPGTGMGVYDISNPEEPETHRLLRRPGARFPGLPLPVVGRRRLRPPGHRHARLPAH